MRRLLLVYVILFTLTSVKTQAQENFGLNLSNYLPLSAIQLNPALSADARCRADIHVVGAAAFASNDHVYLPSEEPGLIPFLRGNTMGAELFTPGNRRAVTDYSAEGPGFSLVLGKTALGLATRYRTMLQFEGANSELAQLIFHGFRHSVLYDSLLSEQDFRYSSLAWGELNLNLSHMLYVNSQHHLSAGLTVKRLFGMGHVGFSIDEATYQFTSEDLSIFDYTGSYSLGQSGIGTGNGWAADIGVAYRRVRNGKSDYVPYSEKNHCKKSSYVYEVGVSILDYGSVVFNQPGALVEHSSSSGEWEEYINTSANDAEEFNQLLIDRFEGDQNNPKRNDEVRVALPLGVSVQFDYDFEKGIHLGAVVQQPIETGGVHDLRRPQVMGLIPRYEVKHFEASLPLSLYEGKEMRLGAAFRFLFITVGSDDLLNFALDNDLYGADVYASIRIPIHNRRKCGSRIRGSKRYPAAPCWDQ